MSPCIYTAIVKILFYNSNSNIFDTFRRDPILSIKVLYPARIIGKYASYIYTEKCRLVRLIYSLIKSECETREKFSKSDPVDASSSMLSLRPPPGGFGINEEW